MRSYSKWDDPSTALFLRRRFYLHNVNPIGPSVARREEDNTFRHEEDGTLRMTEGD